MSADGPVSTGPMPTDPAPARAGPPVPFLPRLEPSVHGAADAGELRALGIDPAEVLDFSANQSPLGASPGAREASAAAVIDAYPDRDATPLREALAARHGLDLAQVVAGNGSTELIRLVAQLTLREGDVALSLAPSFGECRLGSELPAARFVEHSLALVTGPPAEPTSSAAGLDDPPRRRVAFVYDHDAFTAAIAQHHPRLCWICSPNNPTGAAVPPQHLAALTEAHPKTLFVLDEAYCDLLEEPQWTADLLRRGNLLVLRSMTKAWGLAGLRLGYAIADGALAGPLRASKPPWNVNACAQAAGLAALADDAWYRRSIDLLRAGRAELVAGLTEQGWCVLPSCAGFFLIDVGDGAAARERLLARGCLVRDCASFGLPEHVRVSPRLDDDDRRLLDAFAELERPERGPAG